MNEQSQAGNPWSYVFNTPLECGLRSAALLAAAYPRSCDLQRLVQYDYLIVHSGDVESGPPSIHPPTPHRSGELLVRRSLVEQGLEFMVRRRVIEKTFGEGGFGFMAGEYATVFLSALSAPYTHRLVERAEWVIARFQDISDDTLSDFMRKSWTSWGAEFVMESLFELSE